MSTFIRTSQPKSTIQALRAEPGKVINRKARRQAKYSAEAIKAMLTDAGKAIAQAPTESVLREMRAQTEAAAKRVALNGGWV